MYTFFRVSPHNDFSCFSFCLSSSLLSLSSFSSSFSSPLLFSFLFFASLFFPSFLLSSLFSLLSLSSFSVFFLRVLVVCVCRRVCLCGVLWCGVVCAVWCGTLKTLSVCRFKTSPCIPATRAHAFQHVGVVPVHTGTF